MLLLPFNVIHQDCAKQISKRKPDRSYNELVHHAAPNIWAKRNNSVAICSLVSRSSHM